MKANVGGHRPSPAHYCGTNSHCFGRNRYRWLVGLAGSNSFGHRTVSVLPCISVVRHKQLLHEEVINPSLCIFRGVDRKMLLKPSVYSHDCRQVTQPFQTPSAQHA